MTNLSHTSSVGWRKSDSAQETECFGRELGKKLEPGDVVCLFGDLGAGKTTFIKGVVSALGGSNLEVNSPTFVYLNCYEGRLPIYHFDLYRLESNEQFLSMGFDEYMEGNGVCLIEWSERIASILPEGCIQVRISHLEGDRREIIL